jgi:hypothetical protein
MPARRYRTLPRRPDPADQATDARLRGSRGPVSRETAAAAAEIDDGAGNAPSGTSLASGEEPVVRRTADGWRVGDDELPDLTCAMVLADLIAAELPTDILPAVPPSPAGAPALQPAAEEARRLRTTVDQLEHALTARIRIEQAIGVLAERHRIRPRQAFEQLRSAARNRGRRVIDIAGDVVASATNPLLQLPEELSRQRSVPRHARSPRHPLRQE